MAASTVTCRCVASLVVLSCLACGAEQSSGDPATGGTTDVRVLTETSLFEGSSVDNRIICPDFQTTHFAMVRSSLGTRLRRHVYADSPNEAPVARLVGEGRPVDLLLWAQAGDGEHTASVWIATEGAAPGVGITVTLHGVTLRPLDGPNVPVALHPTDDVRTTQQRVWIRYEARFSALVGAFEMRVAGPGRSDLLAQSPRVTLDKGR